MNKVQLLYIYIWHKTRFTFFWTFDKQKQKTFFHFWIFDKRHFSLLYISLTKVFDIYCDDELVNDQLVLRYTSHKTCRPKITTIQCIYRNLKPYSTTSCRFILDTVFFFSKNENQHLPLVTTQYYIFSFSILSFTKHFIWNFCHVYADQNIASM